MGSTVADKVRLVGEAPPALRARKGTLNGMNLLVLLQVWFLGEALATLWTSKGPLYQGNLLSRLYTFIRVTMLKAFVPTQ